MQRFITKTGSIDSNKLKTITEEELSFLINKTSFLELNPSVSQRIKTIIYHPVQEHPKCICGNCLPFSPTKGIVFKSFCSMSCAKKNPSHETKNKFKDSLEKNKTETQKNLDSAMILSLEETKSFFLDNLLLFKNGGSKASSILNNNPDYRKSLFHYTTETKLNGKIYELLYGKGVCKLCNANTTFLSLEKGYSLHCKEHRTIAGAKQKGLNCVDFAVQKLKSFDNFSEFNIVHIPEKLNDAIILKHRKCNNEFEINLKNGRLTRYTLRCSACDNRSVSNPELEIRNWLTENNIEYIPQYEIGRKKIDIVIPEFNLAIEYNGLMDHSYGKSKYTRFNNHEIEDKFVHVNRIKLCKSDNLELIQIFENEWLDKSKKQIWWSILSTRLSLNKTLYARKCEIKIVDTKTSRTFLDENHLQGFCGASVKLGLYYNNELVSFMSFGKSRYNKNYEWELIRFCNKLNHNVIGGASKLFKHFIKKYNPNNMISYCHIRTFNGRLYEKLGFEYSHTSDPGYFYFKNHKILYSRDNFQKHKLQELLEFYDESLTEKENMFNNSYRILYDCGNKIYVWRKK